MPAGDNRVALRTPLTCYYEYCIPEHATPDAPVLVGLHGFGQNCGSFMRRLLPLAERGIAVAAVQAPHQFYLDLATKKVGFNWLTVYERENTIADVTEYIDAVTDDLLARAGGGTRPVFVLGFSQGVSMAWRYAVRRSARVAGMIACCADFAPDAAAMLPDLKPFPAFLIHGEDDPLIPRAKLDEAAAHLESAGWPHDTLVFEGGHEIESGTAHSIADWILSTLADKE